MIANRILSIGYEKQQIIMSKPRTIGELMAVAPTSCLRGCQQRIAQRLVCAEAREMGQDAD